MSHVRKMLILAGFILCVFVAISFLGADVEARTASWDGGGGDNLASTDANWDLDTAPIAGDDVVINSGSKGVTWNLDTDSFGSFTVGSSYSGTVTGASDLYITRYQQNGATVTWNVLYEIYCDGNFTRTSGTLSGGVLHLVMTGDSSILNVDASLRSLTVEGNVTMTSATKVRDGSYNNGILAVSGSLVLNAEFTVYYTNSPSLSITGMILGSSPLYISDPNVDLPGFAVNCPVKLSGSMTTSKTSKLIGNVSCSTLLISSAHASNTLTIDLNGYDLSAQTITVGTRGILICGEGTIRSASVDSSAGTVTNETATWVFSNNALVKMAAGGTLYDVEVNGTSLRLGSDVTMNSLMFISLTTSHPYGLYINGTRTSSVTTSSSGTYSLGSGVFAWDNATLKITPMLSRVSGGALEIYKGLAYWNDYDSSVDVVWALTSVASWLSMNDGNITGTPTRDGNYTYTLTATHANGEVATVSGYVLVETSTVQELNYQIGPLLGLVVGVLVIGLVMDALKKTRKRFK